MIISLNRRNTGRRDSLATSRVFVTGLARRGCHCRRTQYSDKLPEVSFSLIQARSSSVSLKRHSRCLSNSDAQPASAIIIVVIIGYHDVHAPLRLWSTNQ